MHELVLSMFCQFTCSFLLVNNGRTLCYNNDILFHILQAGEREQVIVGRVVVVALVAVSLCWLPIIQGILFFPFCHLPDLIMLKGYSRPQNKISRKDSLWPCFKILAKSKVCSFFYLPTNGQSFSSSSSNLALWWKNGNDIERRTHPTLSA